MDTSNHAGWKEVAVDPEAMAHWECFMFFYQNCGFDKGMLLSNFPRSSWQKQVMQAANELARKGINGEIQTASIRERLRKMRSDHKLFSSGRAAGDFSSWVDAAAAQETPPFHAVVTTDPKIKKSNFVSLEDVNATLQLQLAENSLLQVELTGDCPRIGGDLINNVAGPMLRVANQIKVVDKYWDPTRSHKLKVIECLIDFLHRHDCRANKVEIYTELNPSHELPLRVQPQDYLEKINSILPSGYEVEVFFIKQMEDGLRNHPRFLLTDIGGLSYDHGFEEGSRNEADKTMIGILGGDYRSRLWNRYKADSDVFEIDPSCPSPLRIST